MRAEGPTHPGSSVPDITLIEGNMVLVEKRAHLILEVSLAMVRLLPVDISNQRTKIGRADGKQTVPALPRKSADTLLFHPGGRAGFDLGDNLGRRSCRGQSHRKMNVVSDASCSETLAIQFARGSRKIHVKSRQNVIIDQRDAIFGTEDDMNQVEAQRLRHCCDYMSGLQPSTALANTYLGLRPRLICHRTYGPQSLPTPDKATYQPRPKAWNPNRSNPLGRSSIRRKRQRRDNIPAWAEGPGKQPRARLQPCRNIHRRKGALAPGVHNLVAAGEFNQRRTEESHV